MKSLLLLLIAIPAISPGQTLYDPTPDEIPKDTPLFTRITTTGTGSDSPPSHRTRKFYFFGDSLTDTGNLGRLIGGLGPGYPGFTLSNGPTWPGYLDPSVIGFSEITVNPDLATTHRSVDFATALATTATIASAQTGPPFLDFRPRLNITPNDLAFIWGGANDFLPLTRQDHVATPGQIARAIETGTSNLTSAVTNLGNQGIQKFAVISLIDLSLAPGVSGFDGSRVAEQFNSSLQLKLARIPTRPNLLWIDADFFLNDTVSHPSSYGLTNVTDSIAFDAGRGIPSTLPPGEQAGYLFYDDIHPSTAIHRQFASFVASHLRLEEDAAGAFLVNDALLALDDRSGFESHSLKPGQLDFRFSTTSYGNESGHHRRMTQSYRADFDYAPSEQLLLGVGALYADGESGSSNFESVGIGLDALVHGTVDSLRWETGLGLGYLNGDLDRSYRTGNLHAASEHEAGLFTLHAAIRGESFELGGLDTCWEIGLKQRIVHRRGASESGAASLNLTYDSETLSTTVANLELNLRLSQELLLELSLNPVLTHHGGDLSARQTNGFASFISSDRSGFDVHTARADLIYSSTMHSSIRAGFLIGTDNTWSASLACGTRF